MNVSQQALNTVIHKSLSYEYYGGSSVRPFVSHETEWRNLPFTVVVHVNKGLYHCDLKEKGTVLFPEGASVVIPPNIPHKVGLAEEGILSAAHIHYTIFDHFDLLSLFKIPLMLPEDDAGIVNNSLRELLETQSTFTDRLNIEQIIRSKTAALLLLQTIVGRSSLKETSINFLLKVEKISPVLRYIQENIAENITREQLADISGLSETRFHYVFKEIMEMAPMAYVRNLRLSKGQLLLMTTSQPIQQIALETGFGDIYVFSKIFKKEVGVSPLNYRKNHLKSESYEK